MPWAPMGRLRSVPSSSTVVSMAMWMPLVNSRSLRSASGLGTDVDVISRWLQHAACQHTLRHVSRDLNSLVSSQPGLGYPLLASLRAAASVTILIPPFDQAERSSGLHASAGRNGSWHVCCNPLR